MEDWNKNAGTLKVQQLINYQLLNNFVNRLMELNTFFGFDEKKKVISWTPAS